MQPEPFTSTDPLQSGRERSIIRRLAEELAEIAHLPVQQQKIKMWRNLNGLKMDRPMVLVYAFPWDEINSPELTLQTQDPFHRQIEQHLRRLLFKWRYLRADMVIEPIYRSPIYLNDTGIRLNARITAGSTVSYCPNSHVTDNGRPQQARSFAPLLKNADDIERLAPPLISINRRLTEAHYARSCDLLEPALKVVPGGVQILPFAPMDDLMSLWGIQELMLDFVDRPALIHQAMDKIVSCYLDRLRQMTALNLLALNSNAAGAITQGMGECFTAELPGPDCNPAAVQPRDMWGGATAQILAAVSPAMHDEFALRHERRWLDQFGLTAYGCCEPLHQKVGILRQIKNLRKISMSSWIRPDEAAASVGRQYVFSYKPNPAFLAGDPFDLTAARRELQVILDQTRQYGCPLELILRTIIAFKGDPLRLAAWIELAMAMVGAAE